MKTGQEIAASVDPNTSDDVCTFCRHVAKWDQDIFPGPKPICAKGHETYFRSLSQHGPIWVSDCQEGELKPEWLAVDTARGRAPTALVGK